MTDFIATVVTSFWWLLLLLINMTVVVHVVLIWVMKLDKIRWKKTDYVWLFIAALGLVKTAADTRSFAAENHKHLAEERVKYQINDLHYYLVKSPQATYAQSSLGPRCHLQTWTKFKSNMIWRASGWDHSSSMCRQLRTRPSRPST